MKEAAAHIANPVLQKRAEPFFQRMADEGKDDNAFFSSIQTKLSVGAKDDPYEKEADAMADKVVNSPATAEQAPVAAAESTVQKKTDAPLNAPSPLQAQVQARFESDSNEEKLQKKEEENNGTPVQKKPVAGEQQENGTVQRMCRECDEGDKIFRSGDPDVSGMSKRDAVIAMAKTMLGKIKAKQPGGGGQREGADKLWEIFKLAAPGVWQEDDIKTFGKPYPSWCGIFSVWAHKKAGIDLGNWQMGKGVSAFGTLKQTTSPQPGDIGYIDQPFQHHCIITKVNGATIDSIDGNSGLFSEVIENTRPAKAYSGFFTAFSGADGGTVSKKDIEGSIQKQADGSAGTAPSSVETSLAASKGSGSSLPAATKTEMESGIGADFSNVKIHTDSRAAQMNKELNAQAFAHGNDVYFNSNKFNPDTSSGKHLLAHELTHTVQQGAAPAVQKKPSLTGLKIQKAGPKTTDKYKGAIKKEDVDAQVSGNLYTLKFIKGGKEYKLDLDKNPKEIYLPEISMPYLKHRNASKFPKPIPSLSGRGKTKQIENWNAYVKDEVKKRVEDLTKGKTPNSKGTYFFTLRKKNDFHIIGNKDQIELQAYIPTWNRNGLPNNHQVDHIVEYQLGGSDSGSNYELLDALANGTSGNNIKVERFSRIAQALDYFRQYNLLEPGKFPSVPATNEEVQANFLQYYDTVVDWKLPFDGDGEMYWTYDDITSGKHFNHLKPMPLAEQQKLEGTDKELLIYVSQSLGSPKRIPIPIAYTKNYFKGMDLKQIGDNSGNVKDGDKIFFLLTDEFSKRLPANTNIDFDLKEVAGMHNSFYIQTRTDFNKNMFTKFEGASPVTINDMSLDENYGLVLNGTITADLPLLKGLVIDFLANGPDLNFKAFVDLSVVGANFPKIFKLTRAQLIFSYKSSNNILALQGSIGFEIEKLGYGEITAKTLGEKDGFEVSGKFNFDKSILDGSIDVTYNSVKGWTIKGDANIVGGKKLKGVKDGKIHFEYNEAEETFTLGGSAHLTVPGISEITIDSKIGKDGNFEIKAEVTLAKIPKIKSGKVMVTIGKSKPKDGQPAGDSDWDMGMEGTIEPDFNYGGLSDVVATFGYSKGAYDIGISAKYKKGKFHADKIEAGVTNKPVSKEGKKQEGDPTGDMTFYGGFEMGVDIYDGIGGTITCQLLPDGDVTLDGKVEVKEDKELFSMKPWEKELLKVDKDIPIASCVVVTLNLYIGGQIKLYADLKPLMIKTGSYLKVGNLSLKKFDDPVITSKIILGSSLVAGAKVSLAVGLSASLLGVIKARIAGVADVNFVAIEAAITGMLEMGWSKETGIDIKEASIDLEMASKLIVSFGVKAEVLLDLWLTTITLWDHEWPVAADTIPIDIFGEGKKTWKLPLQSGGKVGEPDHAANMKDVSDKTSPDEVQSRAKDKSEGVQRPKVDKQAQVQQVTQDEVIARFHNKDRFDFNQSVDYSATRWGLYEYLKEHSGMDPKIDFGFIDDEIRKAEFEEYDSFTTYIMELTGFNDDQKAQIIEDFIVNHPTLGDTEITNLRSLIPVKAPPSAKPSPKESGKSQPKKTPDIPSPVKPAPPGTTIQKKSKSGAVTRRSRNSSRPVKRGKQALKNKSQKNSHKKSGENESAEMEEVFIPDMELIANNDFYNNDFEDMEQDSETALAGMNEVEDEIDNTEDNHFKPFYMRSTRTRKPLQQRAEEKSRSAFFSGPDKKEKSNNGAFFQAKLNVGEANDPAEKEADKVADSVTGKGKPKEDRKEDIAKGAGVGKPEQEANKGKTPGADKPAEDKKEKEKTSVQKKGKQEETEEENKTVVNKKDTAAVPATASAAKGGGVESAIAEKNGKGSSMPADVLQEMQSAIGHDFSDVNIHTDSAAAAMSEELDAQAFTTGKDIYFNSGKFDPESESGKHLLAHELTHVVQQNKDTIRRDPKADKEEKTRAQKVRDDYQKALKAKVVNWEEVATLFNAFNEPEQREKMAQLSGGQLFQLHQGAVNAVGVGPYSSAALMTTPVPEMASGVAAAIETQMIHYQYQEAIDLTIEDLGKRGVINRSLLTGGRMLYLNKANLRGEGRVLAPGFDQKTGKAKPSDANIGSDAFSPSAGLPLLYSTIIHEFQHVEQMQKPGESKAEIPDQGNDDQTHIQQEVEAYATELIRAKESGMYNIPDQIQDTWSRLHNKWQDLTDDTKKRKVNELYKKAHEIAQQALGKSLHLIFTPLKP